VKEFFLNHLNPVSIPILRVGVQRDALTLDDLRDPFQFPYCAWEFNYISLIALPCCPVSIPILRVGVQRLHPLCHSRAAPVSIPILRVGVQPNANFNALRKFDVSIPILRVGVQHQYASDRDT